MTQGIFKRIYILYVVVLVSAAFFIEMVITSAVRDNYIDNLGKNLSVQISLISPNLSFKQ
jgi:hypothetical protein